MLKKWIQLKTFLPLLGFLLLFGGFLNTAKAAEEIIFENTGTDMGGCFYDSNQGYHAKFTTAEDTHNITKIAVRVSAHWNNGWTADTQLILKDNSCGNVLATSTMTHIGANSGQFVDFAFDEPVEVSPSTEYSYTFTTAQGFRASCSVGYYWEYLYYSNCSVKGQYENYAFKVYTDPDYTPPPSVFGTIYWAGVGKQYLKWNTTTNIPIYFNVCESYDSINSAEITITDPGYGYFMFVGYTKVIEDKTAFTGPQKCSGTIFIPVEQAAETGTATGTATAQLFINGDHTTPLDENTFDYSISSGQTGRNYIDVITELPSVILYDTATTTPVALRYDLTGLAWEGEEICLFNNTTGENTGNCGSITAAAGTMIINVAKPATAKKIYGSFNFFSYIASRTIVFNYYSANAAMSLEQLTGSSTTELACSAEDWASSDWWDKFRCRGFKMALDLFDRVGYGITQLINGAGDLLQYLFPFNFATQIQKSWETSASSTLPTNLQFLDIADSEGNVNIDIFGSPVGTTTSFVIWGPALFGESENTGLREITKYIFWALFIWYVYHKGKELYDHIRQ